MIFSKLFINLLNNLKMKNTDTSVVTRQTEYVPYKNKFERIPTKDTISFKSKCTKINKIITNETIRTAKMNAFKEKLLPEKYKDTKIDTRLSDFLKNATEHHYNKDGAEKFLLGICNEFDFDFRQTNIIAGLELIKDNKLWLGLTMNGSNRWFQVPDSYENYHKIDMMGACFYTLFSSPKII